MRMLLFFSIAALVKAEKIVSQCPPSRTSIERSINEAYIPGLVAIVVDSTKILYEQAVGYHSPLILTERQPIDSSNSIFVLASISKTFIAVAAMQVVESGLLELDANINQYLSPNMKVVHPLYPDIPITMRHLLSHRAGIGPNFAEELTHYMTGDGFTRTNLTDVIWQYLKNESNWLPVPPSNVTYYSNVGACLAALVVERITNVSFERYVHQNILKPLGIDKKASYRLSDFEDRKNDLVDHYIFNVSWLKNYQNMVPQLNVIQVGC